MDTYTETILESCDDETRAKIEELMADGHDILEAIEILEEEGCLY